MQEIERRRYATEEEKLDKLPGIREYSRQAYLEKRQGQKLEELRDYIEDEKALFGVSSPPHRSAVITPQIVSYMSGMRYSPKWSVFLMLSLTSHAEAQDGKPAGDASKTQAGHGMALLIGIGDLHAGRPVE